MRRKKQTNLIEMIIVSLLKGLWFLVSWPIIKILKLKTKSEKLDKIGNLKRWLEIEKMLESGDEIHAKHAIVEADKFFDDIMKQVGGCGENFADRLRSLEERFSQVVYQKVWDAHKVRNQISHEMGYHLSTTEAKRTLDNFRAGLHGLGAM